jgi:DNA-binding LacI/PurR family transcriptional regulator
MTRAKARLADVARAAGVSLGTASNVFAHPERVREEARARVEAAARELGYHGPDPRGRLLRQGRFHALGLVPPADLSVAEALANPVFRTTIRGVAEACDEAGADLVLISGSEAARGIRTALVDGAVLSRVEHISQLEPARLRRIPLAVIDFDPGPDISSVRSDARAGAYAAARHLVALGHRRFAILSFLRTWGPPVHHPPGQPRAPGAAGMPIDQEKLAGYAAALAEAGIDVGAVPMVQGQPDGPDAARLLLDVAPDATAFLSMSVMQGLELLAEARRRGVAVPGDISVVGFNDLPEAAASDPPLTTVDGMNLEKGRAAARLVLAGGEPRHELLPARLIVRGSTGPASAPPRATPTSATG